jgi:hypothetical protein
MVRRSARQVTGTLDVDSETEHAVTPSEDSVAQDIAPVCDSQ